MGAHPPAERMALSRRAPRRFASAPFDDRLAQRLRNALSSEHARQPFHLRDVREATRRVTQVLRGLSLDPTVIRGGLDVGGAELDHVWAVADGRVIDVVIPVHDAGFLATLRAYVAGDLELEDVDRLGAALAIDRRVIGEYPANIGYVGLPVFGSRS